MAALKFFESREVIYSEFEKQLKKFVILFWLFIGIHLFPLLFKNIYKALVNATLPEPVCKVVYTLLRNTT